jgi:D-alanyl-lipoteichoic acid acyltransferase DltB (MBOAT superfamily)
MFFIPVYIFILIITILIDYFAGIQIEKRKDKSKKNWLILSIISTCLVLFIFKYFNFFNTNFKEMATLFHLNYPVAFINIILPVGLSFHTFQSLSYVIEVYRGHQKAEKHFGIYSLYVMFYPQLVAGPIERPQNMLHQFYEKHEFEYENMTEGLKLMLWGFFKKVVVADRLSIYVNAVYNNPEHHTGTSLTLANVFFAFQIYLDFSGYSDIAIGCARTMGFKLMTNFRRPYFSQSIAEFWKRWHISLSTWFRDYLYISMGGNRVSKPRWLFNLFVTFVVSGFWHGANWTYVIWGALNGSYLIAPHLFNIEKKKYVIQNSLTNIFHTVSKIGITFLLTCFAWIFFRANSLSDSFEIINRIFYNHGGLFIGDGRTMSYGITFLCVVLCVEACEEYRLLKGFSLFHNPNYLVRLASYVSLIFIIMLFGVFDGGQFIYFQF